MRGWEARDAGDGLSYVERGIGDYTERFLGAAIPYDDACRVEGLLERLRLLEAVEAACDQDGRCCLCWHERGEDHLPDCPRAALDAHEREPAE